jgi:hypothetical protein
MSRPRRATVTSANARVRLRGRLAAVAIAATLSVGLVAVGCGGTGKSKTASTSARAVAKREFLAKANAICTRGNEQARAAAAKLSKNSTPTNVAAVLKSSYVPAIQAQIDGIRALGAPSPDQATVTKMLNIAQADLNEVKRNPAVVAGNGSRFADFAKLAHPYGLTACAPNA